MTAKGTRPTSADALPAGRSSVRQRMTSWGLVVPPGRAWGTLTPQQRAALVARGGLQVTLLAVALLDLRRRPASGVRGPKLVWVAIAFVNYLGIGPLAYLLLGRRRSGDRTGDAQA